MSNKAFNNWKKYQLNDFSEINPSTKLTKGVKYPFIGMESVEPNKRFLSNIPAKKFKGSGTKFQAQDTIFARITPCLQNGKIAQFNSLNGKVGFGSTEFIVFRNIKDISDSNYLYYLLQTYKIRKHAENSMAGASGRQRTDINYVKQIKFLAPPIKTQQKIASILSDFDKLIENNRRKIEILEETAQLLYREWFVEFRFPGHKKTKFINSPLGKIPKGWKIKKLNDISSILFGFNFTSNKFNSKSNGVRVVRIRDILSGKTSTFSPENVEKKYLIKKSDLLIGMDGIFHTGVWFINNCYLNQRVARIRSKKPTYFIRQSIKRELHYLQKIIMGATVGHLSYGDIKNFNILIPNNESILNIFQQITNLVVNLKLNTLSLTKTRNLLLPRLLSGKIKV